MFSEEMRCGRDEHSQHEFGRRGQNPKIKQFKQVSQAARTTGFTSSFFTSRKLRHLIVPDEFMGSPSFPVGPTPDFVQNLFISYSIS
jgi:hypothetical protein